MLFVGPCRKGLGSGLVRRSFFVGKLKFDGQIQSRSADMRDFGRKHERGETMKAALFATIVWMLITANAYGQVDGILKGSVEARELDQKNRRDQMEWEAAKKKMLKVGQELFGVDERWGKPEFDGTLNTKEPDDYQVGDWGSVRCFFSVAQKVASNALLANPGDFRQDRHKALLLHGLDCSKVTDGARFILQRPVAITGAQSYKAVSGASKTVLVIECDESKVSKILAVQLKKDEEAGFRTWKYTAVSDKSSSKGKSTAKSKSSLVVWARLVEFKGSKVQLEFKNGSPVTVPIEKLSQADQKYTREEMKRRRAASQVTESPQELPATDGKVGSTAESREDRAQTDEKENVAATDENDRLEWLNASYNTTLRHVKGKEWAEFDNKTGKVHLKYTETARTKDSLEVFCAERKQELRFLANKAELKKDGKWGWVANGHWVAAASDSKDPKP